MQIVIAVKNILSVIYGLDLLTIKRIEDFNGEEFGVGVCQHNWASGIQSGVFLVSCIFAELSLPLVLAEFYFVEDTDGSHFWLHQ